MLASGNYSTKPLEDAIEKYEATLKPEPEAEPVVGKSSPGLNEFEAREQQNIQALKAMFATLDFEK